MTDNAAGKAAEMVFKGHTASEVADLMDLLAKSADRHTANSYTEIAALSRKARDCILYLIPVEHRALQAERERDNLRKALKAFMLIRLTHTIVKTH